MKITICSSVKFYDKAALVRDEIEKLGTAEVIVPSTLDNPDLLPKNMYDPEELGEHKIKYNLIKDHYKKILESDAILVINETKNGIRNYIGGNTFLEMGFAFINKRDIYILNEVPEMPYEAEIIGMQPICLNGDLNNLKKNIESLPTSYLASDSPIKLRALMQGLRKANLRHKVEGFKCASLVPDQPYGFAETLRGSENRLKDLKTKISGKYEFLVAVESGILEFDGELIDTAICIAEDKDGNREKTICVGYYVPAEVHKVMQEKNIELGDYFREKYGISEKDPFIVSTDGNLKREDALADAITVVVSRLITKR